MLRRLMRTKTLLRAVFAVYLVLVIFALFNTKTRVIVSMPDMYTDPVYTDNTEAGHCRVPIQELGPVEMDLLAMPSIDDIEKENSVVEYGGRWRPRSCTPWQKVAIIIPYRDRLHHLKLLLQRLHPMLRRQMLYYQMFVIEQAGDSSFNRGKLMNIGVIESLKYDNFDCFIFHDVDLLPENDKNLYYCDNQLRHLASSINEVRYHVMYYNYAGGVSAVNKENIFKMNGFGNIYWGWGGEDDDFSARSMAAGLLLSRPPEAIGRFKMARHVKSHMEHSQYSLFMTYKSRMKEDGLSSLDSSQYKVIKKTEKKLYTDILVDVGEAPTHLPDQSGRHTETVWWFLAFFFP